jgi:hypothetical protein
VRLLGLFRITPRNCVLKRPYLPLSLSISNLSPTLHQYDSYLEWVYIYKKSVSAKRGRNVIILLVLRVTGSGSGMISTAFPLNSSLSRKPPKSLKSLTFTTLLASRRQRAREQRGYIRLALNLIFTILHARWVSPISLLSPSSPTETSILSYLFLCSRHRAWPLIGSRADIPCYSPHSLHTSHSFEIKNLLGTATIIIPRRTLTATNHFSTTQQHSTTIIIITIAPFVPCPP